MAYSNGALPIHGSGATNFTMQPIVTISLNASDVSRSGTTISCRVQATINSVASPRYFGYYIKVFAQLDNGSLVQLIDKGNSPNRWSDGSYGLGQQTITSTNNSTSCSLNIYVQSNCGCNSGGQMLVHSIALSAPSNTYTISYNANGGSDAPSSQTKYHGTALTLTTAQPNGKGIKLTYDAAGGSGSGHIYFYKSFNSWNTVANGSGTSYASGASFTLDANTTLYAQYNPATVENIRTSTRPGYTFQGWFTADGTQVVNGSKLNSDTTVTARWVPNNYTVTYNANGGTNAPNPQTKYHGINLTLTKSIPSKSIKITYNANGGSVSPASKSLNLPFSKWYRNASNTDGDSYSPGSIFTGNYNLSLYAHWSYASVGTLPTPARANCEFAGWYSYTEGNTKISSSTTYKTNVTIYARWNYLISYDLNGGTLGDDSATIIPASKKIHRAALTLTNIRPTKQGKKFLGWSESKTASTASYSPGGTFTKDEPTTLYAVYEEITYTVTFDLVGGKYTGGGALTQQVKDGGSAVPPSDPTKEGSKFKGWIGQYTNIRKDTTIVAMWNTSPVWILGSDKKWRSYVD